MNAEVVVIIGIGGIGQAIARRQGAGKLVLIADFNETALAAGVETLRGAGFRVESQQVDVSDRASVRTLAQTAASLGRPKASAGPSAGRAGRIKFGA